MGSPPAAGGGGPITDGRCRLTAYTVYAPASEAAPVGVSGLVEVSEGGPRRRLLGPLQRPHGDVVTYAATTTTWTSSCPTSGNVRQTTYTFSGSTLKLYVPLGGGRTVESTYQR